MRSAIVASMTRLYPFYSGRGKVANHPFVQWLAGSPTATRWARVDGGKILADLSEHVGRAAYFCRDLDPKVSWICRRLIRPDDTVVDVGANIGLMTLLMSRLVGAEGRVLAFEPNPKLYANLRDSLAQSRRTNVRLIDQALGASPGSLELRVPLDNQGKGSLVRHREVDNCEKHYVRVSKLDDFPRARDASLIKIDVEGFEPEVLRGAARILSTSRPCVLFESNGDDRASFEILEKHNYGFFVAPMCLFRMRLERYTGQDGNDFLAVPKERYESVAQLVRA